MKWIKASERPDPGISKYHIVRWNNVATTVFTGDAHAIKDYCMINKVSLSQVEWLDETESPKVEGASIEYLEEAIKANERMVDDLISTRDELRKENERLRGLVEAFFYKGHISGTLGVEPGVACEQFKANNNL